MKKIVFLCLMFLASSFVLHAEGTKEIQPDSTIPGYLVMDNGWTSFAQYKATSQQQIKIKIAQVGEKIYFGMNNKTDAGDFVPNVHFRILDPAGNIVYSSVMPPSGVQGNISSYKQAAAGPAQLGNPDGYNALSITADVTGDYVIEYDSDDIAAIPDGRLNLQYFDVTVADLNNKPVTGRLHSQGWQISTTGSTVPFLGTVYPYDGGSAVYKVDFNGMRPWVFVINFNSKGTGTGNASQFLSDRQSKVGNFTNPQFDVFLNPPDPVLYPVAPINVKLSGEIKKISCNLTDFCFSADSASFLEGFLDFNGNGVYDQSLGEIYFGYYFDSAGTHCIPWDGKDLNGNPVNSVQFKILTKIGYGLTYLPLYDVEFSQKGFKVEKVNPPGPSPTLYWDDSQIPSSDNIGPKVNLDGCNGATGCHTWSWNGIDCSSLYACNPPTDYGNENTINTWWYSNVNFDTLEYNSAASAPVALSFDATGVRHKDTTVCAGDSVAFYVFNDGINHFNSTNYTYEWKINNADVTPDVRSQKQKVTAAMVAVVIATSKSDPTCFSSDTLRVNVVNPVKITSTVASNCGPAPGTIKVSVVSGAANPQFSWVEFPLINSGNLNNLVPGQYHLTVTESGVTGCGADTVFTIPPSPGIQIDTVLVQPFNCNANTGTTGIATVQMKDNTKQYEYSWDNTSYTDQSKITGIGVGQHEVIARDKTTLCKDSMPFTIKLVPLSFSLTKKDELCSDKSGSIVLALPPVNLNISWNGLSSTATSKTGLSAGTYAISVTSPQYSSCKLDTTVTIGNSGSSANADFTIEPPAADSFQIGEEVQLQNNSGTVKSSLWQFGDGTTSTDYNTTHAYNSSGSFVVTLQVTDASRCSGHVTKSLAVASAPPCGPAMPNAFSPNGDLVNEDIGVLGDANNIDLKIFNRWGELIFRTQGNTVTQTQRWNGIYRGEAVPIGVYPFLLEYDCPGNTTNKGRHKKVGDITLVR